MIVDDRTTDEQIKALLKRAQRLVGCLPREYRPLALPVVVQLLTERAVTHLDPHSLEEVG